MKEDNRCETCGRNTADKEAPYYSVEACNNIGLGVVMCRPCAAKYDAMDPAIMEIALRRDSRLSETRVIDADRAMLAQRVGAKLISFTDSFEDDDHTGSQVAYMLIAILEGGRYEADDENDRQRKFVLQLNELFPYAFNRGVWAFVTLLGSGWDEHIPGCTMFEPTVPDYNREHPVRYL